MAENTAATPRSQNKTGRTPDKGAGSHGPSGPGNHGQNRPVEKPKDFKGTSSKLLSYLKPFRATIIIVFVFATVSTVFSIVGPALLGQVTTGIFMGITGAESFSEVMKSMVGTITLLVILYVVSAGFSYAQSFMMARVSTRITYSMRRDISEKFNRLPVDYYDKVAHGDILSRITNDIELVNQTLSQTLTQIITSIITVIGVIIIMFVISWILALVSLIVIPISLILIQFVVKRSQKYFVAQQKYLGELNGQVEEMYAGHEVMQAFNGEQKSVDEFSVPNEQLRKTAAKSQFFSSIMMPVMNFVGNLGYVAICVLGSFLALTGSLSVGNIQAFIQYMRSFTQPLMQISSISSTLQSTIAAAERVFDFLGEREIEPESAKLQPGNITGEVEFSHVRFGYDPEKIILKDFSAKVAPGQKIAIIGPTGAGKTTIVKLLMRFYELNGGKIAIDGHDITDFSRDDLRRVFGIVLQDTWLYSATIMENIRYGSFEATDTEVVAAAKAARCDEFIRALPGGYNMVLNEEATNISQGQKQLFTIARAILKNAQILILDEATSSVDTRTEILIQQAMDNLMCGRTSFVIAHRLSTIRNADLILALKDGDVVEQGTHSELIAKGGFYANLYNSQFEQ